MVKTRLKKTKLKTLSKIIGQYPLNSKEWHMACVPLNLRNMGKDIATILECVHYLLSSLGDKSSLKEFEKKLEKRIPLGFKFGKFSNPPLALGEKANPDEIAMFSHWQAEEAQYLIRFIRNTLENLIAQG